MIIAIEPKDINSFALPRHVAWLSIMLRLQLHLHLAIIVLYHDRVRDILLGETHSMVDDQMFDLVSPQDILAPEEVTSDSVSNLRILRGKIPQHPFV
ncbi:hypothetical protein AC579_4830 [Pseudocercospora musae]|uniref:Uncharacterized protein n=1 Tax=Pseudocercospora musae TaxID=113226 RepID=A0A139IKR6_9PEZI|nr:hypothetical protein AC579_4830 [Pseudocercospora musae]